MDFWGLKKCKGGLRSSEAVPSPQSSVLGSSAFSLQSYHQSSILDRQLCKCGTHRIWWHSLVVAGMLKTACFAFFFGIVVANITKISIYMHFEDKILDQISLWGQVASLPACRWQPPYLLLINFTNRIHRIQKIVWLHSPNTYVGGIMSGVKDTGGSIWVGLLYLFPLIRLPWYLSICKHQYFLLFHLTHVLTASSKFLWAYYVKSSSTNFSDNIQQNFEVSFPYVRFNNQLGYNLITESWDHQKWHFTDPCIIKLKNALSNVFYCFEKH